MNDDKFYDKIKEISTEGLTEQLEWYKQLSNTQSALIECLNDVIKVKDNYIEKLTNILEVK